MLVVVGLIGVGLVDLDGADDQAGKNWARITSTVFFALDTIGAIGGLAGGPLSGGQRKPVLRARRLGHRRGSRSSCSGSAQSTEYFKGAPRY